MTLSNSKDSADAIGASAETGTDASDGRLFNRELSWLEFNRHVLDEATDESLSVLERLKFLSIFSTNLDEFFMIRVSGLKEQKAEGVGELSPDGMTATEQLDEIYKRLRPMLKRQVTYLRENILPALKGAGITIESYAGLNAKEKKLLDKYFRNDLFPILTEAGVARMDADWMLSLTGIAGSIETAAGRPLT